MRLGLFALAINLLVPIHVVFDLAESIQTPQQIEVASKTRSLEWRVFALLTGHHLDRADSSHGGQGNDPLCPVCSAAGTLAAFVSVAGPALPALICQPISNPFATEYAVHVASALTAYDARGPPLV